MVEQRLPGARGPGARVLHQQQPRVYLDVPDRGHVHRRPAAQDLVVQPALYLVEEQRGMNPSGSYSRMPGGGISRRPLHLIILADCSGGMKGEKIQALNYAIADMMPHLEEWERDQEQAEVFIRAIAFATEPRWHIRDPEPVAGIRWKPLEPVPKGLTNMGAAFAMAGAALAPGLIERRALRPALLLITDGL